MPKIGAPATEDDLGSYAALGTGPLDCIEHTLIAPARSFPTLPSPIGQSEGSGSEVDISRAKATHTANINIDVRAFRRHERVSRRQMFWRRHVIAHAQDSSAMLLGGGRMPARIQRLMQTRSAVWMFVGLLVMECTPARHGPSRASPMRPPASPLLAYHLPR